MAENKDPDNLTARSIKSDRNRPTNDLPAEAPKLKWWHSRKLIIIGVAVVLFTILIAVLVTKDNKPSQNQTSSSSQPATELSDAVKAGKRLSNDQCKGEGATTKLTESPMKPEDFSIVVPYGLMVGGHVTPIDHQYFSPADYNSKPDAYEVRAMGDATLVDITSRPRPFGQEYRLVFTMSCTFFYYYDLVTSLSPDIKQVYDLSVKDGKRKEPLSIPVKAGQLIGRIGGQTLDFAVWDTTKPLSGFIEPKHYEAEVWKLYTADPLDYYSDELKTFILSRYVRAVEPISGKIDHDSDGKLIGNWFMEGFNGYEGDRQAPNGAYWRTHLAFAPDLYDPSWFIISIGSYETEKNGLGAQFVTPTNKPHPADISVASGIVKYDLTQWSYDKTDGSFWDRKSVTKGLNVTANSSGTRGGCAIVQMLESRKIKFEVFKNKSCASVVDFSSLATLYTR